MPKHSRLLTMETLNLEQKPLQPTPLKSKLVQLLELAGSVDLGIQCELCSFNETYTWV